MNLLRCLRNNSDRICRWSIHASAVLALVMAILVAMISPTPAEDELPIYLRDRGEGISTSLFGTYIRKGELLVYPFYEYTTNEENEYKPSELGFVGDRDFLGKLTEHEVLLFLSYGFTDWLAVEFEAALYTTATLRKAPEDTSDVPNRLEESGLGDVQTQLRWRFFKENERRPELFGFFETVFPLQKDKVLIGTQDWELALGLGVIKGYSWGTITARASVLHDRLDKETEFGEYAVEYLKRVSPNWRLVATIEGESDEVSLIGEAQWQISPHVTIKLNTAFGLTEKAPDWAPEIGIIFSF